jgi:hypothetical protein
VKTYKVAKPLTLNRKAYKVGDTVSLPASTGEILVNSGRLRDTAAATAPKAKTAKARTTRRAKPKAPVAKAPTAPAVLPPSGEA